MTLFQKLEGFVHTAAVKVSDAFVKLVGKETAQKFGQAALALLKTAEGKIVLDAVELIESLNPTADSASKRSQALVKIETDFKTQGLQVAQSIVGLLIEIAVQFLQGGIAL